MFGTVPSGASRQEAGVKTCGQPGHGGTAILRRQPAGIIESRPEGGCTKVLEVICCDCDRRRPHRILADKADRLRRPAASLAAQADTS